MMESWKVANVLHKHSLCDPNAAWGEVPQMLSLIHIWNASFCSGAGYICNAGVQEEKVIQIPLLQEVWNVSESRY